MKLELMLKIEVDLDDETKLQEVMEDSGASSLEELPTAVAKYFLEELSDDEEGVTTTLLGVVVK